MYVLSIFNHHCHCLTNLGIGSSGGDITALVELVAVVNTQFEEEEVESQESLYQLCEVS